MEDNLKKRMNGVFDIIYQHTDEYDQNLYTEIKSKHFLIIKNLAYKPDKAILSETLTIMLKDIIAHFGLSVTAAQIVATAKIRRYYLLPWPKKIIGEEFNIAVTDIFIRGNRLFLIPKKIPENRELSQRLKNEQDEQGRIIWTDPIITGLTLNLNVIDLDSA
jgi:hypothetical protein